MSSPPFQSARYPKGFFIGAGLQPQTGVQDVARSHVTCRPPRMGLPFNNKPGDSDRGANHIRRNRDAFVIGAHPVCVLTALIRESLALDMPEITGGLVLWL